MPGTSSVLQPIRDWILEKRITHCYHRLCNAEPSDKPSIWAEFVHLVNSRSPEQVARMEREKGLA